MKLARWERFALEFSACGNREPNQSLANAAVCDLAAGHAGWHEGSAQGPAAAERPGRYDWALVDRAPRVQPRSPRKRYGRTLEDVTRIIAPGEQHRALSDHHLDEVLEALNDGNDKTCDQH